MQSESSSDGELERLQEAVHSAKLPQRPLTSPKTRKSTQEDETAGKQLLVSEDMRRHLAKKLMKYLDSQYDVVTPSPDETVSGSMQLTSSVRLFRNSKCPLVIGSAIQTVKSDDRRRKCRKQQSNESSESEDEEEKQRLKQAAIDPQIILKQKHKKSKHGD